MDARQHSSKPGPNQDDEGSSQTDLRQKQARPPGTPRVSCVVCNSEIDEHVATKAESRDDLFYFCGLGCFGEWERARSDRGQ